MSESERMTPERAAAWAAIRAKFAERLRLGEAKSNQPGQTDKPEQPHPEQHPDG